MGGYIGASVVGLSTVSADIDGTVTADGLTVDGDTNGDPSLAHFYNISTGAAAETTAYITNSATKADGLFLQQLGSSFTTTGGFVQDSSTIGSGTGASGGLSIMTRAAADMRFYTNGHTNERLRISSGGDISFYEDTGTTAKFFWDASVEGLGIGDTSFTNKLNVTGAMSSAGTPLVQLSENSGSARDGLYLDYTGTTNSAVYSLKIADASKTHLAVRGDGNFGIGTTSLTDGKLCINGGADGSSIISGRTDGGNGNNARFKITGFADGGGAGYGGGIGFQTRSTTNVFSEAMRIDSSGNVDIGGTGGGVKLAVAGAVGPQNGSAAAPTHTFYGDTNTGMFRAAVDTLGFSTAGSERMRIDSSGRLLIGHTTANGYALDVAKANLGAAGFNRTGSDGEIVALMKNGSTVGTIGTDAATTSSNSLTIDSGSNGIVTVDGLIKFINTKHSGTPRVQPVSDNAIDLGQASFRYDDVYATNGTIQTSDQNEKQQIASLTDAEMTAAKAISKLFKTFKWNDSVAEKGDNARTHAGVIAQQVETAMSDAGLDAGNYAFFISTTWWETQTEVPAVEAVEAQDAVYEDVIIPAVEEVLDEEGNVVTEAQPERTEQRLVTEAVEAVEGKEAYTRTDTYDTLEEAPEGATERNRKGIRYPELLSFIGAATEQRLTSIEARLDALEAS